MQKAQLKAARALMGWSQDQFAEISGVSAPTIKRIEAGRGVLHASPDVMEKIQKTLLSHGVEMLDMDAAGGYGVRLRASDDLGHLACLEEDLKAAADALQRATGHTLQDEKLVAALDTAIQAVSKAQDATMKAFEECDEILRAIGEID